MWVRDSRSWIIVLTLFVLLTKPHWPLQGKLLQKRISVMRKVTTGAGIMNKEHQSWMQHHSHPRGVPMQATKVARAPASKIVSIRNRASDLCGSVFDVDPSPNPIHLDIAILHFETELKRMRYEFWGQRWFCSGSCGSLTPTLALAVSNYCRIVLPHLATWCSRMSGLDWMNLLGLDRWKHQGRHLKMSFPSPSSWN